MRVRNQWLNQQTDEAQKSEIYSSPGHICFTEGIARPSDVEGWRPPAARRRPPKGAGRPKGAP